MSPPCHSFVGGYGRGSEQETCRTIAWCAQANKPRIYRRRTVVKPTLTDRKLSNVSADRGWFGVTATEFVVFRDVRIIVTVDPTPRVDHPALLGDRRGGLPACDALDVGLVLRE